MRIGVCLHDIPVSRTTLHVVIGILRDAGVVRYHADLVREELTFYWEDGESLELKTEPNKNERGKAFVPRDIDYAFHEAWECCDCMRDLEARIIRAGCTGYFVHLRPVHVIAYGIGGNCQLLLSLLRKPGSATLFDSEGGSRL